MRRAFLALLIAATPALAAPSGLTVRSGETWLFRIALGQPVGAHRVALGTLPAPGEVRVTVKPLAGTMLTVQSNAPTQYLYRATLIFADGTASAAKSCALPANNRLALESWPQRAVAVRIADFKPVGPGTVCP